MVRIAMVWALGGCAPDEPERSVAEPPASSPETGSSASTPPPQPGDTGTAPAPTGETAVPEPAGDLEVQFLGVGGYVVRYRGEAVMFPPMYSNPDFFATTLGEVRSDPDLVRRFSRGVDFSDVRAILVGHAHYDHLMDAPTLWPETADATFYGSATVRHLLAAYAPDRPASCPARTTTVQIPRDRVVQLDDPSGDLGRDLVDYRLCPEMDPGNDDGAGDWVAIEGTHVRFRAMCSEHPDQVGPIHFGPGFLTHDLCNPPTRADDWVEGRTLTFLVDFLDDRGVPVHRVYYQDAPTRVPVGLVERTILDEKRIDVALLNVGSFPEVPDHPTDTLRALEPRYTIGGHWEDFFWTQAWPPHPIPGHDLDVYEGRASAAMTGQEPPATVDGAPSSARQWVPDPGGSFLFPADGP